MSKFKELLSSNLGADLTEIAFVCYTVYHKGIGKDVNNPDTPGVGNEDAK